MKAFHHTSHEKKRTNSKSSHTKSSIVPKLTPLDFDNFIPWFCLQFQVPIIVAVKRMKQEEYIPAYVVKRTSSTKSKLKESKMKLENFDVIESKKSLLSSTTISTVNENVISINAYYNSKGSLVEIAFLNCPFKVNKKVIQAISLCLPFHESLYKFQIKRGGLSHKILYEISKFMPHSNITDVCLDDNFVAEGNYYVLLDTLNHIQHLSLQRCHINDETCKRLANKLHFGFPASNTLFVLNLASNCITDIGAKSIGNMLRVNRILLYLNLSDNKISDTGAKYILNHLFLFSLTKNEVIARNHRQLDYFTKKTEMYKKCEDKIINRIENEDKENKKNLRRYTNLKGDRGIGKFKKITSYEEPSVARQAEKMTKEIVGDFKDVFNDQNTMYKNGQVYAIGNFRLNYLNLAYNNLGYFSVKKIYDILKYQSDVHKPVQCNGLLKIILEGNNIPKSCKELDAIEYFLEAAINENARFSEMSRCESSFKSHKKTHRKHV